MAGRPDGSSGRRINHVGQPIGRALDVDLPRPAPPTDPMVGRWSNVVQLDSDEHGAALWDAYSEAPDDSDWTYLFVGPFDSQAAFVEWLASLTGSSDPLYMVITDQVGPCGMAAFQRIEPMHGVIEIGNIHLARRLQRTAAATESMYLMMQRIFDAGYRRYEWKCDSLNAPSRAAADRLGFTYEGDFRQAIVYKGRSRDTSWYSIIDGEWPDRRAEFRRWLAPSNFDEADHQRTPLHH